MKEWRRSLKRIFVLVLSVVLIGNSVDLSGLMVSAESAQVQEDVSGGDVLNKEVSGGDVQSMAIAGDSFTLTPVPELPDSEELFAAYVDKTMYGGYSFFGRAAGDTLDVGSKALYGVLKTGIEDIAAGRVASTGFAIDVTTLAVKTTYTAADLGVDSLVVNNAINQEAANKVGTVFMEQFDFAKVIEALLHDCPYEFYWFDKVTGYSWGMADYMLNAIYDYDLGEYIFSLQGDLCFYFMVAKAYQPANYNTQAPTVDTAKTSATTTAAANAAAIVAANESKGDVEKLTTYRDAICDLVTYNHGALTTGTPYGDPWQLVYVFDGNVDTNVVCEGYAKAFQYLCDMSDFDAAECYTVSGDMDGGTGAGGHMWNIVTMDDGKNYIADITNSDGGSVGQNGGLFLDGTAGSVASGYIFTVGGQKVTYAYYDDTKAFWGTGDDSILKLADSKYEKKADYVAKVGVGGTETPYESFADAMAAATDGATVTLLKDVTVEAGTWADDILNVTGNVKLALNGKTLDMGVTGINIGSGNGLEVENGSIKSANSTSAIFVMGSLSLKDVNVSNTTGHYGIFAVTGTEMSIEGGNLEGETAAVSFGGELAIAGSPKFTGGLAGLEIVSNMSSIVVEEAVGAGTTYTLLVNDYGAGKDLISAADGVALKAEWFKDVRGEFVVVQGSTADTLSLLYDFTKATVTVEDATVEYTGSAKAPTLTVAYGDDALTKDTDYTVSYLKGETAVSEMKELGSYTVVITGKGDYAGTVKKSFEIVKAGIASVNVAVTAPAAQAVPQGSIAAGENYTGTISWAPAAAKFGFNTVYKAIVVLTADGNHKFTNGTTYAGFDTAVVSADGTTLTLTKSFDATRKEKLTAAETLAPVALDVYCSDVAAVVAKLPAQVTYTTETGTVKLAVEWTVSGTYNATPDAVNTFTWSVAEADKWSSYDANGIADNGTVKVTNAAALAVNNTANNKEITYDGKTFDVSSLFDVDANAGAASFEIVSSSAADAGAATLSGNALTITKAGKIAVKLTTAAKGAYAAGEATAVLTVNKAAGVGSVSVEDIAYGGTVNAVITSTTNKSYTVRYTGQGYDSTTAPVNAGDYTITVSFAENDLYKAATASDTFTIQKATPVLAGVKVQNEVLYESTLVTEVVLTAESTSVPGNLILEGVTALTVGTKDYTYKFTPDDTANYEVVTGKVSLTVLENALVKIEATGILHRVLYAYGDSFEIAGITVTATYADDSTKDVTSLVSYDKALVVGQTQVTLTYQSKTCTVQGIIVEKKKIDLATVIWDVEAFETYDGKEKTIVLTDNLPAGVKVSYSGNKAIDAGSYQAKVEFELAEGYSADNYQIVTYPHHTEAYSWVIMPKPIDENNTTYVLGEALTYNGQAQTQTMKSVTADGLNVTFDLTDNVATDAGEYEMTVTGKGNFTGSLTVPYSIAKKNISDAVIILGAALTYNGQEQTKEVSSVSVAGISLVATDYTTSGNEATNAGEYTLTVTAAENNNFTGSASAKWSIEKKDISAVEITFGQAPTYNGTEQTVEYTVGKVDGLTVTYDASGSKATDAGYYELTITGNGNFTGNVAKSWSIVPKSISGAEITLGESLTYTGSAQTQEVGSVTLNDVALKATDYVISGNTATNPGTYTLTITGKGNYTGTATKAYTVAKANGSGSVTVADSVYGDSYAVNISSTTNPDYTVLYTGEGYSSAVKPVNAGDYTITVSFAENDYYKATTATDTFTIEKATPVVTGVKAEGKLFESTAVSNVVLTAESTTVPGELKLDGVSELTVGTKDYAYRFTPEDLDNYKEVTGTVTLTVLENTLEKIEASGTLNKATYTYGEEFVLTGILVTATYADGASKDVTALVSYEKALVAGQTEVTLTYQGKTCKVSGIVVEKKAITADNVTYTLGEGLVYNGKAQTQTITTVKADGLEVTYDVTGNEATNAGAYELTITGTGNFSGSVKVPYSVAKKNISGAEITLGATLTYNGAEQTQGIGSVAVDEINLTANDYVVSGNKATDAGEYTMTVTAAENGNFTGSATAKWSMAKKDISAVEITLGEALTYTGAEQTLEYTVGKADGLSITYDASGYKATNAGSYELTITGKGNFTGTVKKAWSIAAKSIADAQVVLGGSLTYNGSELSQTIGSVTVSGITLKTTDYEVGGNKATDAGTYELTITGKGNFTGSVTKAYVVAKAAAPAIADVAKNYVYSAGSKDAVESIDIAALLPKNAKVSSYVLASNDAAYVADEAVSADGKLTYKVGKSGSAGQSTTLNVTISSGNYEDMTVKVVVTLTDKKITVLKSGNEVTVIGAKELTYGQKLSELVLDSTKAVFVADGSDTVVEGTLSWAAPDTVLTAGQAAPQWKFVPNDTETYTEITGTLTINVKKATPSVSLPAVGVSTYHPEKTLSDLTLVGNKGSHTVAGTKVDVDGSWTFKDGAKVPTVKNDGYTVVFTPVDTNNYEVVEKTVAVEVAKATPSVDVKPEAAALTYGQTLADAALTGGKAAYAEGSTIAVNGSFAWKDGSIAPTVADSETTEYAVVFTPADGDNYNTVALKVTVKVAKALNAPNMPVETLTAAHTVTTVGQISLPEGWSWAEEDAELELTVGVAETATAVYVGADAGNYQVETVEITITKAAAPVKPSVTVPESGKPHIMGENGLSGWDVIRKEVTEATTGETVNVDMNGAKEVPGNVFEDIKGKGVTAVFHMGNGLSWTVGGKYITADKVSDLNLGVSTGNTTIPANVLNKVTGGRYSMNITLNHSGEFGLTAILNVNVKAENKGRFANLFYYNPAYGSMQFVCADEISEQGMAHLPFTHASEYVIVIDDTIMNNVFASPKTGDADMSWSLWWLVALAAFAVSGGYAVNKKKSR